jgi:hypothetical protein
MKRRQVTYDNVTGLAPCKSFLEGIPGRARILCAAGDETEIHNFLLRDSFHALQSDYRFGRREAP